MHSGISAGQSTHKSPDASSGKWEDQVTSGHFDRALREADFELEHVLGLRLMTFHESTSRENYGHERILRNVVSL